MYNALLGRFDPHWARLLTTTHSLNGTRPAQVNYHKVFNGHDITCCFYNVTDTLALIPTVAVLIGDGGPVVNLYIPGNRRVPLADGNEVTLERASDYPRSGEIRIVIRPLRPVCLLIRLRIPEWSIKTRCGRMQAKSVRQSQEPTCASTPPGGRVTIFLTLDMCCRLVRSPKGSPKSAEAFRALVRGPIVLARDQRLGGNIDEAEDIEADAGGYVELKPMATTIPAMMQFTVPSAHGGSFPVVDFATSGDTWDARLKRVTWIRVLKSAGTTAR